MLEIGGTVMVIGGLHLTRLPFNDIHFLLSDTWLNHQIPGTWTKTSILLLDQVSIMFVIMLIISWLFVGQEFLVLKQAI